MLSMHPQILICALTVVHRKHFFGSNGSLTTLLCAWQEVSCSEWTGSEQNHVVYNGGCLAANASLWPGTDGSCKNNGIAPRGTKTSGSAASSSGSASSNTSAPTQTSTASTVGVWDIFTLALLAAVGSWTWMFTSLNRGGLYTYIL
jgi:hypothetical protein